MAKVSGLGERLYYHGRNISGDVGALQTVASPRRTVASTGIDSSGMERIITHSDGEISFNTFFNDATNQEHDALKGLRTTDVILSWLLGTSLGNAVAALVAKQVDYNWTRGEEGSLLGAIQTLGNATPLDWMVLLTAGERTDSSAVSAPTSINDGGSTSLGYRAVLQIRDIASGTPTVVLEDSSDDSAFSTLISFTAVADGGEPTAERKTVTGTINQFLRIITTGTFTDLKFVLAGVRGIAGDDVDLS